MQTEYLFTSESVSEGHPDKVCDRISDEVVDAFFELSVAEGWDPSQVRVACETLATTNRIVIAGETRGPKTITRELIAHRARMAIRDIGYEQDGFHWEKADIEVLLHSQSADIAQGVDAGSDKDEGAGDQGIMFGYACKETPELMPAPIYYAHRILKLMADGRKTGQSGMLGPDAKSQLTMRYVDGKPVEVTAYEFAILRALAQRPGRVLSREQLLDLAKGSAELSFDRSIDVHVSRLRAKLGDDSRSPRILKTVRGVGYLLAGGDS